MKATKRAKISKYLPSIFTLVICALVAVGVYFIPAPTNGGSVINLTEYTSINTICELATLKSYYHNVAMYEEQPDGGNRFINNVLFWPFGGYAKVGYKQFWLEYSGIVETGIDASQIRITGPDSQGVVEVFVPDARVLSVYADENSLTEPLSESGWFTKITGKEKTEAFSAAQKAMRQEAENDQSLLTRSKENARYLLQQYIINSGKEMGLNLTVKWL